MSPPSTVPGSLISKTRSYSFNRTPRISAVSPNRLTAPGRQMTAPRDVKTAVSSTNVESGYRSSATRRVSVNPHSSNTRQYASCWRRATSKSGFPSSTLVNPRSKFAAGGRTTALVNTSVNLAHQPFDRGRKHRQDSRRHEQTGSDAAIKYRQPPRVVGHKEARQITRELVAQSSREKPDAHHDANQFRRRKLGDGAEPNRTQAHLTTNFEEVQTNEPPEAYATLGGQHRRRNDQHVGETDQQQAERELPGTRGLPLFQPNPENREHRREHDYKERRQRLQIRSREGYAENFGADESIREEIQARTLLFVCAPKENREEEENEDCRDAFPVLFG